ncbi:DUF418 domain-containing protein [Marinoscillum sp.]|uniref:DUF418 domain-containing protein n=1 Tax=Marinoscillum sp. TaxID=2024838 RepID=UPI003BACDC32
MAGKIDPIPAAQRLGTLDFIRGIAVLGILMINVESFSYPNPFLPNTFGFDGPLDREVRFWVYLFFQGKFFSMFALLFGVGFYIFLERMESKSIGLRGMDIYARRLFWLFIFGVVHAIFIWNGDILYHYAVCGLLLFPFRLFNNKYLVLMMMIIITTLGYRSYQSTVARAEKFYAYEEALTVDSLSRTLEQLQAIETWDRITSIPSPDGESIIQARSGGYWSNVLENLGHVEVSSGRFYFQGIVLRTLLLMLLGMLFYRLGIFHNYRLVSFYWPVTVGVLILGLWLSFNWSYHWTYEYYEKPIIKVADGFQALFYKEVLAIGYVLMLNGLYQALLTGSRYQPFSCVGRMALTNYIGQSVICAFIFYGFGLGFYNEFSRTELLPIVIAIWVIQMVFSTLWLRNHQFGPLEWLWKKLTYSA